MEMTSLLVVTVTIYSLAAVVMTNCHIPPVTEVVLDDPGLTNDHTSSGFDHEDYADIDGEVFVNGAELTDVMQGEVADCYFVAALASIALHNPDYLESMITDNGNGTYTVHYNPWGKDGRHDAAITGANDGFIEMTYDEFVANFQGVQISEDPIGLSA
jgi:hypothetical protein